MGGDVTPLRGVDGGWGRWSGFPPVGRAMLLCKDLGYSFSFLFLATNLSLGWRISAYFVVVFWLKFENLSFGCQKFLSFILQQNKPCKKKKIQSIFKNSTKHVTSENILQWNKLSLRCL